MYVILGVLWIVATQLVQGLLIASNQDTNPLYFVLPMDALMIFGLFIIADRIKL